MAGADKSQAAKAEQAEALVTEQLDAQPVQESGEAWLAALDTEAPSDEELRAITSFDDAVALFRMSNPDVEIGSIEDIIGTGYSLLDSVNGKRSLIGQPFFVQHFRINPYGDYGPFVTLIGITRQGQKFILNDGSQGIALQVAKIAQERHAGGVMVPRGLRESTYDTCFMCDQPNPAQRGMCEHCGYSGSERHKGTTFYLDTQPA